MFIPLSPRAAETKKKVAAFMDEHVYAAEPVYARQLDEQGDRWKSPPVMDELKKKARAAGLWNIFLPKAE
ncbi:MAG TPA: acyl-CoA dehydrogenase, partial [Xanthobacteraceae bacterium]|nr:acyl-CoA dehydrogenase [Xanthobacteraceae bacterium]